MATWNDFKSKATGGDWDVRLGEAYWTHDDVPYVAKVQIDVPFNSLEPSRDRIAKAESGEDVEFQVYFLSEEPVTFLNAQKFAIEWVNIWGERKPIEIMDGPPPGFRSPTALDFTPHLKERFKESKMSLTNLAPLWGQHISYFGELGLELNAGPRQNNDPKVRYQQDWIDRNLGCPFCMHTNWALSYAMELREPEQQWYDPHNFFYTLMCHKCERAVEVVPKELVE